MAVNVRIDKEFCLGHKDCITVCPEDVFGWGKATGVSFGTRIKLLMESGGRQAYVANEEACTACMICVSACPEGAIEVEDLSVPEGERE